MKQIPFEVMSKTEGGMNCFFAGLLASTYAIPGAGITMALSSELVRCWNS